MNAGRCSKGLAVVSALLFATAASAGWQISSTERMVSYDGADAVMKGPRCTVTFNAGHGMDHDMHTLPRGTLEMFIDHDTVAYRMSDPDSTVSHMYAPAIQFHGLSSRGSMTTVMPGDPGTPPGPAKPCGWTPNSHYCEEAGDPETPAGEDTEDVKYDPFIDYAIRSDYVMTMHGMVLHSSSMELMDKPRLVVPSANDVGQTHDPADMYSSYWIDYSADVLSALRMSEGMLSLRVYFPGHVKNLEMPEHPHYVSWSLDLGMMEGDSNEVFAKLEACAMDNMIDGSMAGRP